MSQLGIHQSQHPRAGAAPCPLRNVVIEDLKPRVFPEHARPPGHGRILSPSGRRVLFSVGRDSDECAGHGRSIPISKQKFGFSVTQPSLGLTRYSPAGANSHVHWRQARVRPQ